MPTNRLTDLKKAKHFCILPWVHAKIENTGNVAPCCRSEPTFFYGSLKKKKFIEVWNSEVAKKMRLALLNDQALPQCRDCHLSERAKLLSERQVYNLRFAEEFYRATATKKDGSVDQAQLLYLDLRFSNLCNFKCRICNPQFSTAWSADYKILYNEKIEPTLRPTATREELWELIENQIPSLRKIYFAGGEPLLEEDHYILLEKLLEKGRTDVVLSYNTNLSQLKFKNWNILDLWSKFSVVKVAASLDGIGEQAEYMRKGTHWKSIEENFELARKSSVSLSLFPTLSIMNAFHIVPAVQRWLELGWIQSWRDLRFNILHEPSFLNLRLMTQKERARLEAEYSRFFMYLEKNVSSEMARGIRAQFDLILTYLDRELLSADRKKFVNWTNRLDAIREEKFVEIFPEFREFFSEAAL